MKKTRALCVIVIVIVIVMIMLAFITGCGSTWMSNTEPPPDDGDKTGVHNTETAKPITASPEPTQPETSPDVVYEVSDKTSNNQIIWWADLHHNNSEDKIVVEIINDYDTSDGAKVSIYKGDTDLLIYSFSALLPHAGWGSLYLYTDENDAYLMNWMPGMWQGSGIYSHEVFFFDENDEKSVLDSGSLGFEWDDWQREYEDWPELIEYINTVNSYLAKSWVIADTNGGTLIYSTQDNQIVNLLYPPYIY